MAHRTLDTMTSQKEMTFWLGAFCREGRRNSMGKAPRILILEYEPANAELVTRELRKTGVEFVAKCVTTGNQRGVNIC